MAQLKVTGVVDCAGVNFKVESKDGCFLLKGPTHVVGHVLSDMESGGLRIVTEPADEAQKRYNSIDGKGEQVLQEAIASYLMSEAKWPDIRDDSNAQEVKGGLEIMATDMANALIFHLSESGYKIRGF